MMETDKSVTKPKRMPKKVDETRIKTPKEVWEKYICPSCNHLLDEAVQCACGHRLCRDCAVEIFKNNENPECLVTDDGIHLMIPDDAEDDIEDKPQKFFPDKFAQRDIAKIKVACQYSQCPEVITMKNLKNHVENCQYAGEVCSYCSEFIPIDKLLNHEFECPKMEKACPLSDVKWIDDLDELLNGTNQRDLKVKWNDALAKCKGKKLPAEMYQQHVNESHEDHLKAITGVVNVLMTINAQLFKKHSSVRATGSSDVERDGGQTKVMLKKGDMHGIDVVADGGVDYSKQFETQIMTLNNTVEGMRKDSLQSHKELVTTRNDLSNALEQIKDLRAKVDFFEQKLSTREQQLEEKDFRISLLEAASYDGMMIWRISGFESRTKDARDARYTSIFSLPFYTNKYGYKMCLRLYPLGDGMGKNTHLSLFFVVMKSEYDSLLQWPFTNKVTLTLINQSGGPDVTDTFKPDPKSSSFQRPKTEMNVASGCPRFVPLDDLHRNGFIKDDTIFIKVKVESISTRY